MQELGTYLSSIHSCVNIDLSNVNWHTDANISPGPGWYYLRTSTPLDVLQRQTKFAQTFEKGGKVHPVGTIDIAERASRYHSSLDGYWNLTDVYSGLAAKLSMRAKEHTFPSDFRTGGLCLSMYPELMQYEWQFCFVTLRRLAVDSSSCQNMVLRFGEQLWRAKNGWPLLCDK